MSITITITADYADEVRAQMRELLGETVFNTPPVLTPQRDLPETAVVTDAAPAEPPKAEPEIVPPKRTRAKKEAPIEKAPEAEITDIDGNGDPVAEPPATAEFEGMTHEQRGEVMLPLMKKIVEEQVQEAMYKLLNEAKVANRTEASKMPLAGFADFMAALRKAVA